MMGAASGKVRRMVRNRLVAALVLSMVMAGCLAPARGPETPREEWVQTELFFGLSKQDGTVISEPEWDAFAGEVAAAFPDGLTVMRGDGMYLETRDGKRETRREPSRIVILCYPKGEAEEASGKIATLCRTYMKRFDQMDVLRVDVEGRASVVMQER
jgi:hypothetical protein